MALVLFNVYMLCASHFLDSEAGNVGVDVRHRMGRNLFDLAKLKARTRTVVCITKELQYADDAAIVAHSTHVLQRMIEILHRVYGRMGLKMNTKKNRSRALSWGRR